MAAETAELKAAVGRGFDALVQDLEAPVEAVDRHTIMDLAATAPTGPILVNERQADAAGAIAGTSRLVTVTGPAGTGKTTMLQVAKIALQNQNRRLLVVAPTKKAASVAGREIGAAASSLHAVLLDHGWHTVTDKTGREVWRKYNPGDMTATGGTFDGPRRYRLRPGDRIVVDEAGMVDLGSAEALIDVARTTGAGIALVGDQFQAAPVGHTGAMAMAVARADHKVELEEVHRFKNPSGGNEPDTDYARLSLLLRYAGTTDDAGKVAKALDDRGSIIRVDSDDAVRDHMVDAYFTNADRGRTVALVTATNEDAQTINERIQAERIRRGHVDAATTVFGQSDQIIHLGDVVQTRKNDRTTDVENRALWRVRGTTPDGHVELENLHTPGDLRRVSTDYVNQHVHLAYASTVQGVQGETTDAAVVAGDVDASGLYVGMTRGRRDNQVVTVAGSQARAVEKVADTILRGRNETELSDSVKAAATELNRAARASITSDAALPGWEDTARTFGHVVDVDEQLAKVAAALPTMRDELATLQDQLARDKRTLTQVTAKIAERDSKNRQAAADGRPLVDTTDLQHTRDRLTSRITEREKTVSETSPAFNKRTRTVESLRVEKSIRERLTLDELAAEDDARARRAARIQAGSGAETVALTNNRGPATPTLSPASSGPETRPTLDDGLSF
ncbi:ATP-dependent DNA helicase [Mycetocola zhadangensis]|uniref:ATP-dependent DNA helicase n=1 Tax=Mycetocola zhadangensis TaxID=1164595 RepID=UPI003A4E03E9